jgi:hypothetical protein
MPFTTGGSGFMVTGSKVILLLTMLVSIAVMKKIATANQRSVNSKAMLGFTVMLLTNLLIGFSLQEHQDELDQIYNCAYLI